MHNERRCGGLWLCQTLWFVKKWLVVGRFPRRLFSNRPIRHHLRCWFNTKRSNLLFSRHQSVDVCFRGLVPAKRQRPRSQREARLPAGLRPSPSMLRLCLMMRRRLCVYGQKVSRAIRQAAPPPSSKQPSLFEVASQHCFIVGPPQWYSNRYAPLSLPH